MSSNDATKNQETSSKTEEKNNASTRASRGILGGGGVRPSHRVRDRIADRRETRRSGGGIIGSVGSNILGGRGAGSGATADKSVEASADQGAATSRRSQRPKRGLGLVSGLRDLATSAASSARK